MDSQHPPYPSSLTPTPVPSQPSRRSLSKLAVVALVFGLLVFVPVVGMVVGAIALTQIKDTRERGKGLAVTGLVLNALSTVVIAVVLATSAFTAFVTRVDEGVKERARNYGSTSLHKGDCIDTPGDDLEDTIANVGTVPCSQVHTAEVVGVFTFDLQGGYPGEDYIVEKAESRCWKLTTAYAMDTWAVPGDVDMYYFSPSSQSWDGGDREVTCLFGKDGGPLKGSLRQDATMLDEHQVAYLKAANTINDAKSEAPEEENVEDNLEAYKQWADDVTLALDEEARILGGHKWPAAAEPHVTALKAEIDAARAHWVKAAKAKDADTYYEHYEAAEKLSGYDEAVKARKALGLATTDGSDGSANTEA
ncbi:DUF4190 domain-containing protein [Streptomyces sp. NPDC059718]